MILRFLGTTPSTSNIQNTMVSILKQLCRAFNISTEIVNKAATSKNILKEFTLNFFFLLSKKFPQHRIIFLIDSVDQLTTSDYELDWVLPNLPSNMKMIYSTIGTHGNILKNFKEKVFVPEKNIVPIDKLDVELATNIIKEFLKNEKRSLSELQWETINDMFENAKLFPLYVKLIFDVIRKWSSFDKPNSEFKKCRDIDNCIKYLFTSFEKDHGKLLFSRSIIYMSSFANGISESEIEDILSLDDEVLYDIFEFHAPPIRKLPIALWSRIKYDLRGYMVEKEVDETRVIYW